MKTHILLLIALFSCAAARAASRANFLSHGPSAAAFGRGETSAEIRDASAAFYNPAALLRLNGTGSHGAAFSAFKLFDGSAYGYAGISGAQGAGGAFALSAINLGTGGIEARENIDDAPGSASASQWAFEASLARRLGWLYGISAGITAKYVSMNLYGYSGGDAGLDAGLSKTFAGPEIFSRASRVTLGLASQNIVSPRVTLASDEETYPQAWLLQTAISLPLSLMRNGSGGLAFFDELSISADTAGSESGTAGRFGAEYRAMDRYALRAGFYGEHLTAGAGWSLGAVSLDYSADFSKYAVFHRFGAGLRLGARSADAGPPKSSLLEEAILKAEEERAANRRLDEELGPELRRARGERKAGARLSASDRLRDLLSGHPDYAPAAELYAEITSEMAEAARGSAGADFEGISYARGFARYAENDLRGAVNEWEKVLQANPDRQEAAAYIAKARVLLEDLDRSAKEEEAGRRAAGLYEESGKFFEAGAWVKCVKACEKLKTLCEKERFPESIEWRARAEGRIAAAVDGLSREMGRGKAAEAEVDARSAEKKYNEGLILYAQGKLSGAARMWEIALRFNPGHDKARQAFDRVQQELGQSRRPSKQLN